MGDGYGPLIVAKEELKSLKGEKVAVPGLLTTAYLVLKLYEPEIEPVVYPFDQILDAVLSGQVKAGLVIHEGQLGYQERGLLKVVDLGEWWKSQTGLPLPLGRFVSMYVNQRTLDYGEDGRKAVRLLLELGYKQGIIKVPPPDVVFSDEVS